MGACGWRTKSRVLAGDGEAVGWLFPGLSSALALACQLLGRHDSCSLLGLYFSLQLKVPTTDKPTVTVNFRKLLLNRCQKEFEKDKDDDEIFEKRQKEMDDASAVSWDGRLRLRAGVGILGAALVSELPCCVLPAA